MGGTCWCCGSNGVADQSARGRLNITRPHVVEIRNKGKNIMKRKLALLVAALLCLGSLSATAQGVGFSISIGDRPYYNRGPWYWNGGARYYWVPGHWAWRHHHRVWVHGYYGPRPYYPYRSYHRHW